MRPRIVAGNWKMYTNLRTARELAEAVVKGVGQETKVGVILCPPFPYLTAVAEVLAGSRIGLGGQNCYEKSEGAYTGEVGPKMLADVGCQYVILGHSERRHGMMESDALVANKVANALKEGLRVILCIGETLAERQEGRAESVFDRQAYSALHTLTPELRANVVVAYEPVWAIGTGEVATPELAQRAHAYIRKRLGEMGASELPILYGGSVKADNAAGLFSQPDIDGGLIGGASLQPDGFLSIVRAAVK